jgi:type IV pilus assembly protein PilN
MSSSTALMPLDPAVSPEQALRILPIRANLLPEEILSGRNARRTRFVLIGAVVLVAAVMGGWYLLADSQRDLASSDLASVTKQADGIRDTMRNDEKYKNVTTVITERDEIKGSLKTVLTKDLPFYTLIDGVRGAAEKKGGALTAVVATVPEETAANAAAGTVGTLQIAGTADDKAEIADVVDAIAGVDGVVNVYLTAASGQGNSWIFTLTADISTKYECGRFSATTCGSK